VRFSKYSTLLLISISPPYLNSALSIQEVEKNFGIQVLSIISLSHLVDYLKQGSDQALIERIEAYNIHRLTNGSTGSNNIVNN
jgi:hypothetical protein